MPLQATSIAARQRLRAQVRLLVASDEKYDYDKIRPAKTRHLATTLINPSTAETYVPYGPAMFQAYDIQLDKNGPPKVTSNYQLPEGHLFPASSEYCFGKELIKLHAFHDGTITRAAATAFLPPELRGHPEDPRSIEFVAKMIKSKDALRKRLVIDTLVPLILKWIDSKAFVQLNITIVKERTNFWAARINEDESLLAWWLKPLGSVLNLKWLFQSNIPLTAELIELKDRMKNYCRARMVWTAEIVYLHLIEHDPMHGRGFFKNQTKVTANLQDIKLVQSVSRWEVPIQDWPSFTHIKKP